MFAQKLLSLLKDKDPISVVPVTLHRGGHVEAHIEQYLASEQGRAALRDAEAHWRHWQGQRALGESVP